MTLDEAIFVLEKMKNTHGIVPAYEVNALSIAIRSLEAWEKVKEEISEAYKDFQNDDTCIANGINICRRIIDKHLKEVEK